MRWTLATLLAPVAFVLSIVAAALTGNRTDSFWLGLLAFFIGLATGRVLRALVAGRPGRALYRAVWPVSATGYAFLFAWLGLPTWASFFVSFIAATLTRGALAGALLPGRVTRRVVLSREDWGLPGLDDVVPGRSREI